VARAIDFEMKKRGLDHVDLDISHQPPEFIKEHFPTILGTLPGASASTSRNSRFRSCRRCTYTCGGVVTDLAGRTDLPGLYAVGETAYTGLHGANRLASNSLLECLVVGRACAHQIAAAAGPMPALPAWDESRVTNADEEVVIAHNWDELRRFMWNYVGIVRTTKRLERAQHRIRLLQGRDRRVLPNFRVTRDLLELRNLVEVASLIVNSALSRQESRGLHYSLDYPDTLTEAVPTVLSPQK
jgi:L-aspartate oxidase